MQSKYFNFKGTTYVISKHEDGLWRDAWGCIYALAEDENSVDNIDRCGIGFLSLPINHPANAGCSPHDYKYSSPAYQLFHTRAEADADLERDETLLGFPVLGKVFRFLAKTFGGFKGKLRLWENDKTR